MIERESLRTWLEARRQAARRLSLPEWARSDPRDGIRPQRGIVCKSEDEPADNGCRLLLVQKHRAAGATPPEAINSEQCGTETENRL
jgi:hypothetical protein